MALIGISDARLKCGESNHWWADVPYYVEPNENFPGAGRKVWRRRQHCEREGCERIRVMVMSPRDKEVLSVQYTGPLERIGPITRGEIRAELIRRQGAVTRMVAS